MPDALEWAGVDDRAAVKKGARGALKIVEALRRRRDPPPLLFTFTNTVYGSLEDIELRSAARRYDPVDPRVNAFGFVFRMSCIFGTHQSGTEYQGRVAHFLSRTTTGKPDALLLAHARMQDPAGHAFHIGGGPGNAIGLQRPPAMFGEIQGEEPRIEYGTWRNGDQRYYASDTWRWRAATGWRPQTGALAGVAKLYEWLARNSAVSMPALKGAS